MHVCRPIEPLAVAQLRQQGRSMYSDLDEATFRKFPAKLLDRKNIKMVKEEDGLAVSTPLLRQGVEIVLVGLKGP